MASNTIGSAMVTTWFRRHVAPRRFDYGAATMRFRRCRFVQRSAATACGGYQVARRFAAMCGSGHSWCQRRRHATRLHETRPDG